MFNGRDECIRSAIHEASINRIGCTSPYGSDKSKICTNSSKGKVAGDLMNDLLYNNLTESNRKYPKTCTYMMSSFSSVITEPKRAWANLELRFQSFIKVSRSRLSYGWLELLAKFGGYVGLFLGVSINQILFITGGFLRKVKTFIGK